MTNRNKTKEIIKEGVIFGNVAHMGKAVGKVRIVNTITALKKVEEGDILVSTTAKADLFPALKKASALVTDSGGIVCLAAIKARELKKPCIVGTRIATQVLKDGDLVEVDTEKGIINIIKKSK